MSIPPHQLHPNRHVVFLTAVPERAADGLETSLGDVTPTMFGIENAATKHEQSIFEGGIMQDALVSFSIPKENHEPLQKYPAFDSTCSAAGNLGEVPALTPVVLLQDTAFGPRSLLIDLYWAQADSGQPFDLSKYRPRLGEMEMTTEAGVDPLYAKLAADYIEKVLHAGRIDENARAIDESATFNFERRGGGVYNPRVDGIQLPVLPSTPIRDPHNAHIDYRHEED